MFPSTLGPRKSSTKTRWQRATEGVSASMLVSSNLGSVEGSNWLDSVQLILVFLVAARQ
jgi:hypothetical protein